jgi:hypothetical protein
MGGAGGLENLFERSAFEALLFEEFAPVVGFSLQLGSGILPLRGRTLTDRISAQFPFPACRVSGLCVLTDV